MATNDKDTIYIDIDDEITGIIDKLRASNGKVVALVLPKRASVFQSIVNMKLLKRSADNANKHLVLITSEAGLLPLAGAAGVHVAKTLTSKPEIPQGPLPDDAEETVDEETGEVPEEITADSAGDKPVGALAGLPAAAATDDVETLVLDDDVLPEDADGPPAKTFDPPTKGKKNKKLQVPNFERFRLLLIIGGLVLILLIAGLIAALNVLPKATINITTDATNVHANLNLNLSTTAKTLDTASNTLPAKLVQQQKTYTQQVATTGQKNNGNKATGTVTVTNCDSSDVTIPAGTGLSSGGNTYISQQTVTVPDSNFTSPGSGSKCKNDGKANVEVTAQSGGAAYNLPSGANFTVAGNSHLSGQSSTISGGTDSIVQTVNQNDITNAKNKISTNDTTIKQTLQNQLSHTDYYPIATTFSPGTPTVTTSANVGDAVSTVTVTEVVTYTMFGVHETDLKKLVDNSVKGQIDTSKQSILTEGLDKAVFGVTNSSATGAQLTMEATATAGPQLDVDALKRDAAGKKPSAIKAQLQNNPDVTGVDVQLSPFWVSSVPGKTSKITVNIAKPKTTASTAHGTNP